MDDDDTTPLDNATFLAILDAIPETPDIIAHHLRLMVAGKEPYQRFTHTSRWIKNIWAAAADMIEERC